MRDTALVETDHDAEAWVARRIAERGYAQISVHDPASGKPGFAFTVGLEQSRGRPELFCMGVAPDVAGQLFSLCIEGQDAGKVDLSDCNTDITSLLPGYALRLRLCGHAVLRLANDTRPEAGGVIGKMVQVLMPDDSGAFPGDPACAPGVAAAQDPDWLLAKVTN